MDLEDFANDVAQFTHSRAYMSTNIEEFNHYILSRPEKDFEGEKIFIGRIKSSLKAAERIRLKYPSVNYFKIGYDDLKQSLTRINENYQNEFEQYIDSSK